MVRAKGSNFEYEEERDKDLMRVFNEVLSTARGATTEEILRRVVNSPSERFWVSEERATLIVKKLLKGRNPHIFFANKRTMYGEILFRVTEYREAHPNTSIKDAVRQVVHQPAPQFYITPGSAAVFICNARKRERARCSPIRRFLTSFRKDHHTELLEEYLQGRSTTPPEGPSIALSECANECSS